MSRPWPAAGLALVLGFATSCAQAELVSLAGDGAPVAAHWLPVATGGPPRPAVIALHGCGGLYQRDGKTFAARYTEYVDRLHRAGYHVLLPDSFGARGARSICTQRSAERTIKVDTRRGDVAAAVRWLARQPAVDKARIALLGWSHGAMTALAALDRSVPGSATPVAGAVVFYPGCQWLRQGSFEFDVPVLLLLGANDDWTPPARCIELMARLRARRPAADVNVIVYPDSYHGFDSARAVRFWSGVPNGVDPAGVHLGGNPQARVKAQAETDGFLARVLK